MASLTSAIILGGKGILSPRGDWKARRARILRDAKTGQFLDAQSFRKGMREALTQEGGRG
ncbi:MAG: hypothetical protein JKP92_02410 [Alphaproteobacteria bacterium]|jgi:hypothetical protein|nr:hypothetical protein [Alphaproteobacteria bacterium]